MLVRLEEGRCIGGYFSVRGSVCAVFPVPWADCIQNEWSMCSVILVMLLRH